MSTLSPSTPASAALRGASASSVAARERRRRRAMAVTAIGSLVSLGLLVDLLLVGHTNGEQIWGPVTAALAAVVGALSLTFLVVRGRNRGARIALIALWLTVAFFGFGGYNSHRLPFTEGTVDSRPRPPLAPLVFTGIGIAGAHSLRSGTKGN